MRCGMVEAGQEKRYLLLSFTSKSKSVATVREGAGGRWSEDAPEGCVTEGSDQTKQEEEHDDSTCDVHDQRAGSWRDERRSVAIG